MILSIDLIVGLTFGIEHLEGDPEDDEEPFKWMIVVHLGIFRVCILKI